MAMRIGIDARFYGEAGPGRYAKNIVKHLEKLDTENDYVVFLRSAGFKSYTPENPRFTKVLADYKWYSWGEQIGFLLQVLKQRLAIFYVPHFNIPVLYPFTIITAIPDIIMHSFSTEKGTTLPKPYFKLKKLIYKLVVFWAVLRSKKVIVPSNDVLNDFVRFYPFFPKTKYQVVYEGVDPVLLDAGNENDNADLLREFSVTKPFLLYVSSMYEHKNVNTLLTAYQILQSRYGFKGQLVLVGKKDHYSAEIAANVEKAGISDSVIMPGMKRYITDSEVVFLRRNASVYVFPSLKEGFSLTPLEAQAVGLPCVISDIPCHREIFGDSVLYFNPNDANEAAQKINEVLTDETVAADLIKKGYERVTKYDWNETAAITLEEFA